MGKSIEVLKEPNTMKISAELKQVLATFDPNEMDYDLDYLGRFHRRLSKQMTALQKAAWKAHRKECVEQNAEPVLIDFLLGGAFEAPKALAATAGR
jgi:hypothetical protein